MPAVSERPSTRRLQSTRRRLRAGPYLHHPDDQLVALAKAGQQAAYAELVERYQRMAFHRACALLRDRAMAEDIAQEALFKAYRDLDHLKEPRKFSSWLQRIVRNTCMDFLRAQRVQPSLQALEETGYEAPRATRGLQLEKAEHRELEAKLLDVLRLLRPDYREIVELKYIEKLSYPEIAERLEMTPSAVGEKLFRVRKLLMRRITTIPVPSRPPAGAPRQGRANGALG